MVRVYGIPRSIFAIPVLAGLATMLLSDTAKAELPPDQRIDQLQVCQDCHDLSKDLNAGVGHSPVTKGECSACHNPHASRFETLLLDQPGSLCRGCHPSVARQGQLEVVHRPVAEGRCGDCHNPHGSPHADLLLEPGVDLCASCHPAVERWQSSRIQHRPFAQGRCETCHESHASDNEGLLKTSGPRVCQSCHPFNPQFSAAHAGYPVERAACQTCHDPHASSRKGLFRETVHEAFASGRCEDCHVGGSNDPFATVKKQDALCADCHQSVVQATATAPFAHVSGGSGQCTSCHNPHAGEGAGMLRRDLTATCLKCHDPGGSSSGQPGRYVTHAGEVECTTCHSPHGGEWPLLAPNDPVDVCGECHTHEHGVRHPLGEEILDPRNGVQMDCGSCHGIHYAPYEEYLYASDEGDLCLDCHRDLGGDQS